MVKSGKKWVTVGFSGGLWDKVDSLKELWRKWAFWLF